MDMFHQGQNVVESERRFIFKETSCHIEKQTRWFEMLSYILEIAPARGVCGIVMFYHIQIESASILDSICMSKAKER